MSATDLILVFLFMVSADSAETSSPPNVVFVICDSMDGRVVDPTSPVYQTVRTPHLDQLASNGVNFVNNYCPSPQCVPSRSSMFAGRYVHKLKSWNNAQGLCVKWNDTNPTQCLDQGNNSYWNTFDYQFQKAGYDVNLFGKVDVGAGIGGGFHGGSNTDTSYAGLTAWTRAANITHPQKKDPRDLVHDNTTNPFEGDARTIANCVKWLHDNKNSTKPFFLYCGINIPHPAYSTNATWLAMVNNSAVKVPTWVPFSQMHPADQYEAASKALHYDSMKSFTHDDILNVRRSFYAMCAETDAYLGLVVDALKEVGKVNNTFVLFTSDHGEGNMEHMQTWKNSMYDANNKVPLIISGPGIVKGNMVANATSNIDIYPSLLDFAGLSPKNADLDGHSLFPFLFPDQKNPHPPRPDFVFGEYHSNMANTGHFMIKKGNYKYVAFGRTPPYEDYKPQLFDLSKDWEEVSDMSYTEPETVLEMDSIMRSIVDIQAVDKECKEQDKERFRSWFAMHHIDWVEVLAKSSYNGPSKQPFGTKEDLGKMAMWINGTTSAT